jgi:hypothetical protein
MVTVAVAGALSTPRLSVTTSEKVTVPEVFGTVTETLELVVLVLGLVGDSGTDVVATGVIMGGVSTGVVVTGSRMGAVVTGLIEIGSASGLAAGVAFCVGMCLLHAGSGVSLAAAPASSDTR